MEPPVKPLMEPLEPSVEPATVAEQLLVHLAVVAMMERGLVALVGLMWEVQLWEVQ